MCQLDPLGDVKDHLEDINLKPSGEHIWGCAAQWTSLWKLKLLEGRESDCRLHQAQYFCLPRKVPKH